MSFGGLAPGSRIAGISLLFLLVIGCSKNPAMEKSGTSPNETRPNIILISIDTLRADHMSLYGYAKNTTPFLRALAEEALVFDEFSENGGGTLPSHVSMLTSLFPRTHRILPARKLPIPEEWTTLPEHLQSLGYHTGGFTDCIWLMRKFGFEQGFDHFDDLGGHALEIIPRVYQWLETKKRKDPFFLFIHLYDVHSKPEGLPYHSPEPYFSEHLPKTHPSFDGCRMGECATRFLKKVNRGLAAGNAVSAYLSSPEISYVESLYDLGIGYIDEQLQRFIEKLRKDGLYDSSLIVITADHGENFLEHGRFLHSQGLYDSMTQVPLLIKLPGGAFGGTRITFPASIVDIAPTILATTGLPPLEHMQGKSLVPTWEEQHPVWKETYIWEAVRTPQWKYVKPRKELFHLQDDPGEQHNLADQHPELIQELGARLGRFEKEAIAFRDELRNQKTSGSAELTVSEREELQSLGYLSSREDTGDH